MTNGVFNREDLNRIVVSTTPVWKAKLYAKHGNKSLINEIKRIDTNTETLEKAPCLYLVNPACSPCDSGNK